MKEHIITSEIAWKIRSKNLKRLEIYEKEIVEVINKIKEKAHNEEKQDVAIVVDYYIRVGNDLICCAFDNWRLYTSCSAADIHLATISKKRLFYQNGK